MWMNILELPLAEYLPAYLRYKENSDVSTLQGQEPDTQTSRGQEDEGTGPRKLALENTGIGGNP